MHAITAANLHNAYGGESMAHMRYKTWGDVAKQEGLPNVARLFRAIAAAEVIHANSHFKAMKEQAGDWLCTSMAVFGIGASSQNLQGAINGETYEITEMYPTFLETAKLQGEKGAQLSFHYALASEKTHAALFQKAKAALDSTKHDAPLGAVHICDVCGWTVEGDIPDVCPVCGAKRDKFTSFA
ncbi:MAG: rubrerythrin family protein [Chloroflexi bacterium]|nr:rubrerythrin family protein [Chloroflexota bacterium]